MTIEYDYKGDHIRLTADDEYHNTGKIQLKYRRKGPLIFEEWLEIFGYLEKDGGVVVHHQEKQEKDLFCYPGFGTFVDTLSHTEKRTRIKNGRTRVLFKIPFRGS